MKYFTLLFVLIFCSSFTFSQWQIQNSGTTENLNDVETLYIVSGTSAIVVGDNGIILKTTNSGNEWIIKSSGITNNLKAVSFCTTEDGVTVGDSIICITNDGGETWLIKKIDKTAISVSYYWSSHFGRNIIVGCSDGTLMYSTDVGTTWIDTLLTNEPIVAVGSFLSYPYGPEIIIISSNSYTASTNYPISQSSIWTLHNNPIGFWDLLTGGELNWWNYLIGWGGNPGPIPFLLKKNNLDTIWTRIELNQLLFQPKDIAVFTYHELFICGNSGKIFVSTDDGFNWLEQTSGTNENLNSIKFRGINPTGYIVGDNGTILFTSNGGGINNVEEILQPERIHLYQNYPNPFNPSTTIEYEINSRQYVQLKIFDLLGTEISTLVNEEQEAGIHKIEFNKSESKIELGSGIYFYQLITFQNNIESIQTRKMILLK